MFKNTKLSDFIKSLNKYDNIDNILNIFQTPSEKRFVYKRLSVIIFQ